MSLSDNYPVGMSYCDSMGIAGNCGQYCPKLVEMNCEHPDYIDDYLAAIIEARIYQGYSEDDIAETKKEFLRNQ